jgi:hypothetical protein
MGARVWYRVPLLILGLAMALTAAAIEFLPQTLYFPVIEYTAPGNIRIAVFRNGELERSSCERAESRVAAAIRANCPACRIAQSCFRGLDARRRKILSREPLSTPSARIAGGKLTMTFSSRNPRLALAVCRQIARETAAQPADRRLHCFPALAPR